MKKLMIGLAASALSAAVFADVTSQNIVGYTADPEGTGADNNFVSIPFTAVGYNTSDIQQIVLSDPDDVMDGNFGWGMETFAIWAGVPKVVAGSEFFFYDPGNDPLGDETEFYWGDEEGYRVEFSIAPGQAATINCAEGIKITTSGQVPKSAVEFTSIADNNFAGNPFPAEIDIQNIVMSDPDDVMDGNFGWGMETFAVWAGVPKVVAGSEYFFYDPGNDPLGDETEFYWGDEEGYRVTYPIKYGQGVVINCAEGLKITINPPYSL